MYTLIAFTSFQTTDNITMHIKRSDSISLLRKFLNDLKGYHHHIISDENDDIMESSGDITYIKHPTHPHHD